MPKSPHRERHRTQRAGWLRAAVLGANDGIVSTASLMVGVAAASVGRSELLLAGAAGLVAGAMSMAAGEYVSVSSQADLEQADLLLEQTELKAHPSYEKRELASIYADRGLTPDLAMQVADQLTERDALAAHARDELELSELVQARPLQAAIASASSFCMGAVLPLVIGIVSGEQLVIPLIFGVSLLALAALGGVAARMGGAPVFKASLRVFVLGALAMALTAGVGKLFG